MHEPTRSTILAAVRQALEARPTSLAAWEGGSAAFGALDAYSDVDLAVIVTDDAVEATFVAVEGALAALAPIALRYHVPAPTWHGHAQRFYRLEGASPYLMVDLTVMPAGAADHFLEPRRHGTPALLFDRAGLVVAPAWDAAMLRQKLLARLDAMTTWFELTQPVVQKEVLRGRAVDALAFYHSLTLRPLVELLRIAHCPARHDFGLRYLDRDLPAADHARITALAFVKDLADLEAKQAEAAAWFAGVRAGIDVDALEI